MVPEAIAMPLVDTFDNFAGFGDNSQLVPKPSKLAASVAMSKNKHG